MRERIHHDLNKRIRNRKQEPILDPASKNLQAGENAAALPVVRHHKAKVAELKRMVYLLVKKESCKRHGKVFCSSTCDGEAADGDGRAQSAARRRLLTYFLDPID